MKDKIIHRNQWYSTIILRGGLAICDIEKDENDPNKCWLLGVRVLEGWRGFGYGNELLEAAKEEAQNAGYNVIQLKALTGEWVVDWYEEHGYHITEQDETWTKMEQEL